MRPRTILPPITIGELRRGRIPLWVRCNCGHRAEVSPFAFEAPYETPIAELKGRLKCGQCGERRGVDVGPEPTAWVVYLDRTGQQYRQPFYAGMVRSALASERGE
jgi:hypothetical protein